MDELSSEELRELEEHLYSQIHHGHVADADNTKDNNNTPSVEKSASKLNSNRYWVKNTSFGENAGKQIKGTPYVANVKTNQNPFDQDQSGVPKKSNPPFKKPNNANTNQNRVPNPLSLTKRRQNSLSTGVNQAKVAKNNEKGGPFARKAEKLERVMPLYKKRQKTQSGSNIKAINLSESITIDSNDEDGNSDAEVVHVPLPPVPIYTVDDSDEDSEKKTENSPKKLEENVEMNNDSNFATPKPVNLNTTQENISRCNSPCSVMSQDDFLGQSDCHRLSNARNIADDEDLLILTNNSDSLLEPPTPPPQPSTSRTKQNAGDQEKNTKTDSREKNDSSDDIECLGTFIKPTTSAAGNNKNDYRVDKSGSFQAMDVYESESDIVSDGVYSKASNNKSHQPATTIRNINDSDESEVEDISALNQARAKKMRKRRASGSVRGSESNGCATCSDSDSNEGVTATAVPFISRGPAVETYKTKKFRKRSSSTCVSQGSNAGTNTARNGTTSGRMSDDEFVATLNSLAKGNDEAADNEEDSESEATGGNPPTARDIAEIVLNQQSEPPTTSSALSTKTQEEPKADDSTEKSPDDPPNLQGEEKDKNTSEEATPAKIVDDIEKLLNKINQLAEKKSIEVSDEDSDYYGNNNENASHILATSDISEAVSKAQSPERRDESEESDSIKYFIAHTPANGRCLSDGFGWNEEMRRFYNCSWGGESFTERSVLRSLRRDRNLWRIQPEDRILGLRRNKREKCVNCMSFGHVRSRCPKPKKPLICFMCGESGHQESRCPNACCLNCGSKTSFFIASCGKCMYWNNRICPICKLRGHSINVCPDKWRRYHSTTRANVYPNSYIVYNKRRFCCYCGRRGHLSDECRMALSRSEYAAISSEVKSHEKSYEDTIGKHVFQGEIPCRLLFDPSVEVDLGLAEISSDQKTYGRFLSAVGLKHLMKAKRNKPKVTNKEQRAIEAQSSGSTSNPEQVCEISESLKQITNETECLQMPPPPPVLSDLMEINTSGKTSAPIDVDTDSNYSFSDFDLPTASLTSTPSTSSKQLSKTTALPDFIPLSSTHNDENEKDGRPVGNSSSSLERTTPKFGISMKFVEFHSDDEDNRLNKDLVSPSTTSSEPKEMPCEAKIFISNRHGDYFKSAQGEQYLAETMKRNNLTGNLISTSVGPALFINGLPRNQEDLQRELEAKYKSLKDEAILQAHKLVSCKVPKSTDMLTSLLREDVNKLFMNLGNASDLCKQLDSLDRISSKKSMKSADHIRKTLNMIFLGQAGLLNGDKYLDTLLDGLRTLVKDFPQGVKAPEDLRDEIDDCYRRLFTPYRHKDYDQMLIRYLRIPHSKRNRLKGLNIEPSLLGRRVINVAFDNHTSFDRNQQQKKVQTSQNNKEQESSKIQNNLNQSKKPINEADLTNQTSSLYSTEDRSKMPLEATKKTQTISSKKQQEVAGGNLGNKSINCKENIMKSTPTSTKKNQNQIQTSQKKSQSPPQANASLSASKSNAGSKNTKPIDSQDLIMEIDEPKQEPGSSSSKQAESRAPSGFWSRESVKFIKELIVLAKDNPTSLERLERIKKKALDGGLSYNDYRTVIKLYQSMAKK